MAIGDFFHKSFADVQSDDSVVVDASSSETGAVEVHTFAVSGPASVHKLIDTTNSGLYNVEILIQSSPDVFHSQSNKIEIAADENMKLRITNDSDSPVDVHITGMEINN